MVIEHFTKVTDGKFILELFLVSGCWTKKMKKQAEKYYFDTFDNISEIRFC